METSKLARLFSKENAARNHADKVMFKCLTKYKNLICRCKQSKVVVQQFLTKIT